MAFTTVVPLNTMLADLDETLRRLLKDELGRHGFDGVEIAFEAPDKEWAASLSSPTVNIYLYDLREAIELRPVDWEERRSNGGQAHDVRPPLRVEASFAVTAWTRAVEDEHRLLSQVLAIFYAYPVLPEHSLAGALADDAAQRFPLHTKVVQTRQNEKADFWNAVGGQYKASVDYVVTLSCEPGTTHERGPEVRTQTLRLQDRDGGRATMEELQRIGGVVRDAAGEPVGNAWVVLPATGAWSLTDEEGRFRVDRLAAGTYRCLVRGPTGEEAEAEITVPGPSPELTLAKAARKPRR